MNKEITTFRRQSQSSGNMEGYLLYGAAHRVLCYNRHQAARSHCRSQVQAPAPTRHADQGPPLAPPTAAATFISLFT
jgi:hypothetical protein